MKLEGREISRKILEEAIGSAAVKGRGREADSAWEAALGGARGEGAPALEAATAAEALGSLLHSAAGAKPPAGAEETAEAKSAAGGWSSAVPTVISGLLTQRSNTGTSGWSGFLTNLNPIAGGILRLFGGGEATTREPFLARRPAGARYELGIGGGDGGYYFIDRGASGEPRPVRPLAAPTVVVQVEAMDSRSFLERTPEIAEALKRALLESEGMQNLFAEWRE